MTGDANAISVIAYLDESKKPMRNSSTGKVSDSGEHYVVAAAVLMRGDQQVLRQRLHGVRRSLGRDLHYSGLSPVQRSFVARTVAETPDWDGVIYETATPLPASRPERRTRSRLLTTAFMDLTSTHGVDEAVFETRATPSRGLHALDEHDHATWYSLVERGLVDSRLTIRHENKSEPLLWLADALAGSRTDYLCGVDRGVFPLLAHRVTIRRVAGLR